MALRICSYWVPGDAPDFGCSLGCGIGKCSANVGGFRREIGKMKGRKSFVFMEPAAGIEPATY
jgi:hypothetical protein